jgi:hypothetical protein
MTTNTRFEIDPVLGTSWRDIMARREFQLMPLLKYLKHGIVHLSVDGTGDLEPRYRCSFEGVDIDGQGYRFSSSSTDGLVAIDDTVARLRRTLTRRHQSTASNPGAATGL